MSYRTELQKLVNDLRHWASVEPDPGMIDRYMRQAEVLEFFLIHTEDAVANLDTE